MYTPIFTLLLISTRREDKRKSLEQNEIKYQTTINRSYPVDGGGAAILARHTVDLFY